MPKPKHPAATPIPRNLKASRPIVVVYDSDDDVVAPAISPSHLTGRLDTVAEVPQTKRSRHSTTEDAPAASREDMISQMPLDVLIEILGYLPSLDLISMSRTCHLFQGILHESSETIERIWEHGRRISWFPCCLGIISEARWAILLFREHCEGCGSLTKRKTDFYIRRHFCKKCKLKHCIRRDRVPKVYPNLDESALTLIPYTKILRRFKGRRKVDDYFLKADIAKVMKELEFYEEIKQTATPDADTALEEFKEYRRGLVEEIKSRVCRLEMWDNDLAELDLDSSDSDSSYDSESIHMLWSKHGDICWRCYCFHVVYD